jgi:hypothetical protein
MSNTNTERILVLEVNQSHYKESVDKILEKLDRIDGKLESLNNFKMTLIGISSVIPLIISLASQYLFKP